jgi:hypothetical protein
MDQLGDLPCRRELLEQPSDSLFDDLSPKPAGDQIEIGPGVAGPRGQRTRQALSKLVEALRRRREQRVGAGPAA